MAFTVSSFQTPKAGGQPEECEDAFLWDETKTLFAIADGATDSAFQRLWATLLVEGFINNPPDCSSLSAFETWFKSWLETQQQKWNEGIDWNKLPWHGLNKARQTGGLATFLGLYFSSHPLHWYATAIGDCNLFIFRQNGTLLVCYPIHSSSEFGSSPFALSSINRNYESQFKQMGVTDGFYHSGDVILLATDALAAWCVCQLESGANPLKYLLSLKCSEDFTSLVTSLRQKGQMRDDDTSLLIIQVQKLLDAPAEHNTEAL